MDPATATTFISLVANSGLPLAITIFVFFFGWKHVQRTQDKAEEREKIVGERLTKIEDFSRTELVAVIKENTAAASANAVALKVMTDNIETLNENSQDQTEALKKLKETIVSQAPRALGHNP